VVGKQVHQPGRARAGAGAQGDALAPGRVVLARRDQLVGRELAPADLELARVGRAAPAAKRQTLNVHSSEN
jgi:hypothetical protein